VNETPVLPQNDDAERNVIGAMLQTRQACETALAELTGREFYRTRHQLIYEACRRVYTQGHQPDIATVHTQLEQDGQLEDAGGRAYIVESFHLAQITSNIKRHCQIVRDNWRKRQIIGALGTARNHAFNGQPPEQLLRELDQQLDPYRDDTQARQRIWQGIELASRYEQLMANPLDENDGVPTPFPKLGTMMPGRLYVLGGYQGDGKTVLAVQFLKAAVDAGRRVGFVSLEMSQDDLTARIVGCHGVPYQQAQTGAIEAPHRGRAEDALRFLCRPELTIIDDPVATPPDIGRYQAIGRYDLLIVDHLHRMAWEERRDLEQHIIAITNVARIHQVPILLLCQLTRAQGDKPFPRPTMRSLRDSAMIEAEASAVWLIWRTRDDDDLITDQAELIQAKARFGRVGKVPMRFVGSEVRFEEAA
jgi:replicative DNA helicase